MVGMNCPPRQFLHRKHESMQKQKTNTVKSYWFAVLAISGSVHEVLSELMSIA